MANVTEYFSAHANEAVWLIPHAARAYFLRRHLDQTDPATPL